MKQVEGTALLVTISEDLSNEPLLKTWALDKTEKKTGAPKCLSTLSIQNGRKQFPVSFNTSIHKKLLVLTIIQISAFATLENLSQLAVGFANGAVTVIRGDLINDRGAKQRTVFESEEPITGVEFREGPTTLLYLATTGRILTLTISGKGQGQPAKVLEDNGCGVGCMTSDEANGDIVVVRDDAIYYYGINGRGPSFAYEGPKQLVSIYGNYIAVVSPPKPTAPGSRKFGGSRVEEMFSTSSFALLDTDLKYFAYTETLLSQVKALFMEWGDLFLLTMEGKLFRYHEKTLQQKLEILYQRDLYVLAINFAQKAGVDTTQRNIILRKYGDYLHKKGDFDTAMQQYLKAIDNTEPSQIIRKFLDSQRINNLIEYLEELHDHDKATIDHTTLLLNCYAKLKDTAKLETFIKSGTNFDLETAISMCRQGGYYGQAVFLAKKNLEHDLVISILIEDSKKYPDALDYIWRREPNVAYSNLMRYARVLLENCSDQTTQLFIDYYTGAYRIRRDRPAAVRQETASAGVSGAVANLSSFIPLPYRQTSINPSPATAGNQELALRDAEAVAADAAQPSQEYDVPKPRTAFSPFVDHPDNFITFLEACLKQEHLDKDDMTDLYTTLFEMYLETATAKKGEEKEKWEAKARRLVEGTEIPIDSSNVLLLSHLSNFREGTILVKEQQGLRFDIFRSYTSANDTVGAIKALRKYGREEPQLYPAALAYFTSSPQALEEAGDELDMVLKKINDDGLMAPLQVIQTLSTNAVATMGMVKKYLSQTVEKERKEIFNNRRLIESYRTETEAKRQEIDDLENKPAVFQTRRCAVCGRSLDLPTVHFLCKHSFHQSCLNEAEGQEAECPKCAPMNNNIRAFRKAQEDSADRHDMFQNALANSRDKFGTISEFFGRGVMTAPVAD